MYLVKELFPKYFEATSVVTPNELKGVSLGRDFFDFFTGAGLFGLLLG